MPDFGDAERRIRAYFDAIQSVKFRNDVYTVADVGKPTCYHGEPKTDIYILLKNKQSRSVEVKISYKKENADFLENKTNAERAEQLFGPDWQSIIERSTEGIKDSFYDRMLVYKEKLGRTNRGSITLGWKFELLNKPGGDLSGKINLSLQQVKDVYAGTHLSDEKRNASVNGKTIRGSGVANYILMSNNVGSAQDVIDDMIPIDDYVAKYPNIYFACKALNYRTFEQKYDGNRPLSVQVDWEAENAKMVPHLIFDEPLELKGNDMADRLLRCMKHLGIRTTDDINSNDIDMDFVYGGRN